MKESPFLHSKANPSTALATVNMHMADATDTITTILFKNELGDLQLRNDDSGSKYF